MDVPRLKELAAHIRKLSHTDLDDTDGFNMASYHHDCGTPSCIAGWAEYLFPIHDVWQWSGSTPVKAASILGMSVVAARELLFEPLCVAIGRYDDVTPERAALALERVAAGETDVERVWA